MNNKPRVEEFEAAFISAQVARLGESWRPMAQSMLQEKDGKGDYSNLLVFWAYWAWAKSRSQLVIELPAPCPEPEAPDEAIDDRHMDAYHAANKMRQACAESIEATGAKVAQS